MPNNTETPLVANPIDLYVITYPFTRSYIPDNIKQPLDWLFLWMPFARFTYRAAKRYLSSMDGEISETLKTQYDDLMQ